MRFFLITFPCFLFCTLVSYAKPNLSPYVPKEKADEVQIDKLGNVVDEVINLIRVNLPLCISDEEMIDIFVSSVIKSVDGNGDYFPPKDYDNFKLHSNDTHRGFGFTYIFDGKQFIVSYVFNNSPSQEVGLLPDDVILKINNIDLTGKSVFDINNIIDGLQDNIALTISRPKIDKSIDLKIVKKNFNIDCMDYFIENDVAVIKIYNFSKNSYNTFNSVVAKINNESKEPLKSLIIDLRGNKGGFMDQVISICSSLLPKKSPIVKVKDKENEIISSYESDLSKKHFSSSSIFILVDEQTASAAEILAGALQINGRATILGKNTYGKGTVQDFFQLSNAPGSSVKITIGNYIIGNDVVVDKVGIKPDILINNVQSSSFEEMKKLNDIMLLKALIEIKKSSHAS